MYGRSAGGASTTGLRKIPPVPDETEVLHAYDGSSVAFRALEGCGWNELVNLGFFPLWRLPALALGLAPFQRDLARRSLALVEARPGERVLDVGCGRGYTTALLGRMGCEALGVDLLEANVATATALYGEEPGVRFAQADATRLPASAADLELGDASFDAVHCLEAAFHFGAKGRRAFLEESARILRPGGRLVLVDFTWRDGAPEAIESIDARRIVRDTWRFTEFEPLERYRAHARALGLVERACHDWTRPVIDRFQKIGGAISRAGTFAPARAVLRVARPKLARIRPDEWRFLVELMRAHDAVRRRTRYVALVFEKPRG